MKHFTMFLFLLSPFLSFAQFSFGLEAGVNLSNIHIKEPADINVELDEGYQYKPGFDAGVFAAWQTGEHFRLQSGLLYSRKGTSVDVNTDQQNNEFDLHYLTVPLLAKYQVLRPLWLSGGVDVGYLISSVATYPHDKVDITEIWTRGDFGVRMGVTWQVADRLQVNLDYRHGLTNIGSVIYTDVNGDDLDIPRSTNRSFLLSLGYAFLRS